MINGKFAITFNCRNCGEVTSTSFRLNGLSADRSIQLVCRCSHCRQSGIIRYESVFDLLDTADRRQLMEVRA
jgi:transcription elongation factor Elf1